jgi:hypothetical protein
VPEGRYQAVALRYQGPEWIRAFGRWSLLVEFELLDSGLPVCVFFNLGSDRSAFKIGRKGNYFKAWTLANGELPRKGQAMSPDVFFEGQVFAVEVRDRSRNAADEEKSDAEIYSAISEIVAVEVRCPPCTPNQESFNQESRIKQSPNQAINQSGLASSLGKFNKPQQVSPQPGEG